jgi:hypothetical protein
MGMMIAGKARERCEDILSKNKLPSKTEAWAN